MYTERRFQHLRSHPQRQRNRTATEWWKPGITFLRYRYFGFFYQRATMPKTLVGFYFIFSHHSPVSLTHRLAAAHCSRSIIGYKEQITVGKTSKVTSEVEQENRKLGNVP